MSLRPLFARVLIKRDRLKSNGIIIPDSVQKRHAPATGIILDVGEACEESVRDLRGKKVLFGLHAGAWVNPDGTAVTSEEEMEFFVCQDEDIIAEVM